MFVKSWLLSPSLKQQWLSVKHKIERGHPHVAEDIGSIGQHFVVSTIEKESCSS
jgi:hypothetical protein